MVMARAPCRLRDEETEDVVGQDAERLGELSLGNVTRQRSRRHPHRRLHPIRLQVGLSLDAVQESLAM
jgi:hypothetical protein